MHHTFNDHILAINCGTSSLKFALFRFAPNPEMECEGYIDKIGSLSSYFIVRDQKGVILNDEQIDHPDIEASAILLIKWLKANSVKYVLKAIGHRIIQGGLLYKEHQLVSKKMIKSLRLLVPLAPNHLADELKTLELLTKAFPGIPQTACFDTVFHKDMPFYSRYFPLPRILRKEGVQRYGFHGLSYEYIFQKLKQISPLQASGKVIIAHLGNGASITAVLNGKSIDTTMGLTPAGGLIMGTRSGDLDPGIALYLMKKKKISLKGLDQLVNHQSGLKGISGISSDMHILLKKEKTKLRAQEAVTMFCYQASKFISSLTVALEGVHCLVFTGGIGENASSIRARICSKLRFLGVEIDRNKNNSSRGIISTKKSAVTVRVVKTNEQYMIAQHTYHITMKKHSGL